MSPTVIDKVALGANTIWHAYKFRWLRSEGKAPILPLMNDVSP